jgi:transcriptional regulator of acetoin/glycerol metabolism
MRTRKYQRAVTKAKLFYWRNGVRCHRPRCHRHAHDLLDLALYEVAIRASGGNVAAVARALGVSTMYAHRRLRALGLLRVLEKARTTV